MKKNRYLRKKKKKNKQTTKKVFHIQIQLKLNSLNSCAALGLWEITLARTALWRTVRTLSLSLCFRESSPLFCWIIIKWFVSMLQTLHHSYSQLAHYLSCTYLCVYAYMCFCQRENNEFTNEWTQAQAWNTCIKCNHYHMTFSHILFSCNFISKLLTLRPPLKFQNYSLCSQSIFG